MNGQALAARRDPAVGEDVIHPMTPRGPHPDLARRAAEIHRAAAGLQRPLDRRHVRVDVGRRGKADGVQPAALLVVGETRPRLVGRLGKEGRENERCEAQRSEVAVQHGRGRRLRRRGALLRIVAVAHRRPRRAGVGERRVGLHRVLDLGQPHLGQAPLGVPFELDAAADEVGDGGEQAVARSVAAFRLRRRIVVVLEVVAAAEVVDHREELAVGVVAQP